MLNIPLFSQLYAELEDGEDGNHKEHPKPKSEQTPCCHAFYIVALISGQALNQTVRYHGDHQEDADPHGRAEKETACQSGKNADQFPGAAGADGKLPSAEEQGPLRFAVAAKNDGQPAVCP